MPLPFVVILGLWPVIQVLTQPRLLFLRLTPIPSSELRRSETSCASRGPYLQELRCSLRRSTGVSQSPMAFAQNVKMWSSPSRAQMVTPEELGIPKSDVIQKPSQPLLRKVPQLQELKLQTLNANGCTHLELTLSSLSLSLSLSDAGEKSQTPILASASSSSTCSHCEHSEYWIPKMLQNLRILRHHLRTLGLIPLRLTD